MTTTVFAIYNLYNLNIYIYIYTTTVHTTNAFFVAIYTNVHKYIKTLPTKTQIRNTAATTARIMRSIPKNYNYKYNLHIQWIEVNIYFRNYTVLTLAVRCGYFELCCPPPSRCKHCVLVVVTRTFLMYTFMRYACLPMLYPMVCCLTRLYNDNVYIYMNL